MTTDDTPGAVKADRKLSASTATDKSDYEITEFGRKRRSAVPKHLVRLIALISIPFVFLGKANDHARAWLKRAGRPKADKS